MQGDNLAELSALPLNELLQREQLQVEDVLQVKDFNQKVKRQMKIFVDYCLRKKQFTDRLITLGLHCPMHESHNLQTKSIAFAANDILTSDHDLLVNLFIQLKQQVESTDAQIKEEIEVEKMQTQDQYKFLHKILQYFSVENPDENCLNYICKTLNTIQRVKNLEFLRFLSNNKEYLAKMIQMTHFAGVSHFIAKIVIEDDDKIKQQAKQIKNQIVLMIIQKIHSQLSSQDTVQVFECVEQILKSTRYNESSQRSVVEIISDIFVSEPEIDFYLQNIDKALSSQMSAENTNILFNSISYLNIVVQRYLMEEGIIDQWILVRDVLKYQIVKFFRGFCLLVQKIPLIYRRKYPILVSIKYAELLLSMTKYIIFYDRYFSLYSCEQRLEVFTILISFLCSEKLQGVFLSILVELLQKWFLYELKVQKKRQTSVNPCQIFQSLSNNKQNFFANIKTIFSENAKQRNINQNGVFYRKMLLLINQYLMDKHIMQIFPQSKRIASLIQNFEKQCSKYIPGKIVNNHPNGYRAVKVRQLEFLKRNENYYPVIIDQLNQQQKKEELAKLPQQENQQQQFQIKRQEFVQINKINDILSAFKSKRTSKENSQVQNGQLEAKNIQQQAEKQNSPKRSNQLQNEQSEPSNDSPKKKEQLQAGVTFFTKHLFIY